MIVGVVRPRGRGMGDIINGRNGPVDVGSENQLGDPSGQDAPTLHSDLAGALSYLSAMQSAIAGSDGETMWNMKVAGVRARVQRAYDMTGPGTLFLGNKELAAYMDAANSYADLWRRITLSPDTVQGPPDVGGVLDALTSGGSSAINAVSSGASKLLGEASDTASAIKWTAIGLGAVAVGFIFYLTFETGRTARAIGPRVLR